MKLILGRKYQVIEDITKLSRTIYKEGDIVNAVSPSEVDGNRQTEGLFVVNGVEDFSSCFVLYEPVAKIVISRESAPVYEEGLNAYEKLNLAAGNVFRFDWLDQKGDTVMSDHFIVDPKDIEERAVFIIKDYEDMNLDGYTIDRLAKQLIHYFTEDVL